MDKEQLRPVRANQATMWTLSADRKLVRLAVPPLQIVGFPKPLDVYMDFDAKTVDAMLERRKHPPSTAGSSDPVRAKAVRSTRSLMSSLKASRPALVKASVRPPYSRL